MLENIPVQDYIVFIVFQTIELSGTYQVQGGVGPQRAFTQCAHRAQELPRQPLGLVQSHGADAGELTNHGPGLFIWNGARVFIQ